MYTRPPAFVLGCHGEDGGVNVRLWSVLRQNKSHHMKKQRHLLSLPASEKIGGKLPCLDWRFA